MNVRLNKSQNLPCSIKGSSDDLPERLAPWIGVHLKVV
jgi:hypothetical protein